MDWWSELWLNEGFATWVGWLATDRFHPDHLVWGQFVAESTETGFQLDSLRSSHPIEVPVKDVLEVDQIFDAISYLKGSSVIRMLSQHLGVETFLSGVTAYLKKHQFGSFAVLNLSLLADLFAANATTNDLWEALSKASGKNVNEFMVSFSKQLFLKERPSLTNTRIHGLERLDFLSSLLLKSQARLGYASPVFFLPVMSKHTKTRLFGGFL